MLRSVVRKEGLFSIERETISGPVVLNTGGVVGDKGGFGRDVAVGVGGEARAAQVPVVYKDAIDEMHNKPLILEDLKWVTKGLLKTAEGVEMTQEEAFELLKKVEADMCKFPASWTQNAEIMRGNIRVLRHQFSRGWEPDEVLINAIQYCINFYDQVKPVSKK